MKTYEHITAALAEVERFQSNAMDCWKFGGSEGFVTAIHLGWEIYAESYISAIRHLDAALALSDEVDSKTTLLKVSRALPVFERYDGDEGIWKEVHYTKYLGAARALLTEHGDTLRDLALRLEASEMVEGAAPGDWLTVTKGAERLTDKLDELWDKERCKTEISRRCDAGTLDHTGKNRARRINPLAIDALALSVRDADIARNDEEFTK
jgi:hypothetical protein